MRFWTKHTSFGFRNLVLANRIGMVRQSCDDEFLTILFVLGAFRFVKFCFLKVFKIVPFVALAPGSIQFWSGFWAREELRSAKKM